MSTPPRSRNRTKLRALIVAGALLAVSPAAMLPLSIWASSGSWEFGARGLGHWLLVSGTLLDRLGLVDPAEDAPRYSVSLTEGNSPGWSNVNYRSLATPDAVIAQYAARCEALTLRVVELRPAPVAAPTAKAEASLVCRIEPYLDAEVRAGRAPDEPLADVRVSVWGRN